MSFFFASKRKENKPEITDPLDGNFNLGQYKLLLQANGEWKITGKDGNPMLNNINNNNVSNIQVQQYQQQIANLQQQLQQAQLKLQLKERELTDTNNKNRKTNNHNDSNSNTNSSNNDSEASFNKENLQYIRNVERRNTALTKDNLNLKKDMDRLEFKNKVLTAMCSISEGDYLVLCEQANVHPIPRYSRKKQINTFKQQQQQQQQQRVPPYN